MVKGTLDWDQIDLEVCDAVKEFLAASKTPDHRFVNVRLLTSFIDGHPHPRKNPHLMGGWDKIHVRCTRSMQRMGWKKWSGHVYLAPQDESGKIRLLERPVVAKAMVEI